MKLNPGFSLINSLENCFDDVSHFEEKHLLDNISDGFLNSTSSNFIDGMRINLALCQEFFPTVAYAGEMGGGFKHPPNRKKIVVENDVISEVSIFSNNFPKNR